ncbi:MAG: glutamate--tRNA ligase family protein, partial [Patescibacteria group bacterium]
MEKRKNVVVRFPPSPTGLLHIGGVRTALYNWLFARQNSGKFLLRIEDTDKERSKKEYEENIFDSLKWLGLNWDNGEVHRQSERSGLYKEKLQELIKNGAAYLAEEQNSLDGAHQGERRVVRFRNPGGKIKFNDLIRGEVEMEVGDLNDFIIAKNIDESLYHLTVVVDDLESGVTHVIRGEDHLSNTPRQILILEALGGERPIYAHLPLVLATDKSKLSKRKHGEAVSLNYYREKEYLPEAILNFVAMIGWNPGTDQEIFTLQELIKAFDISKVQKKGGILNVEKLDWINREHILRQGAEEQFSIFNFQFSNTKWKSNEKTKDEIFMKKLLKIMLERIHCWGEVKEVIEAGEFDYLFEEPKLDLKKLPWKNQTLEEVKKHLEDVAPLLRKERGWGEVEEYATKEGKGQVLWPLRYALSGKEKSPDP